MRTLVRVVLIWATFALVASIVFFPSSVNGADFLRYIILVVVALWILQREIRG